MTTRPRLSAVVFLGGLRGALLVACGLLLVGVIALLDYAAGPPHLSFSIFYLLPVAAV